MSNMGREPDPRGADGYSQQPVAWEKRMLQQVLMASIKEQRSARWWKIFFRLLWTALIVGYVVFLFSLKGGIGAPSESSEHVGVVDIKGGIMADEAGGAKQVNEALRAAFSNKSSTAVILRINSPGGSPVQAEMIYDEIIRLKAKYNKPVYAAIEDAGASAAYYIAAATDDIYVGRSAIVGSIGVLTNQFGFVELLDKVGVERRLVTSGGHKGIMDPFSPMKPSDKVFMENMLNRVHQSFIDAVKKGRGDRLKIDNDTFSGLFWTGEEAIDRGLADGLGTVESIARDVVGVPKLVDYTREKNMFSSLARQLGAGVGDSLVDTMNNTSLEMR